MPGRKTTLWIAAGLAALTLAAAGSAVAQERARAGRGAGERHGKMRAWKRGRLAERLQERRVERRKEGLRRMKRLMELPDEQVRTALEVSVEARGVVDGARAKAAAELVKAFREGKDLPEADRAALRGKVRARMKEIREEARRSLTEAGRKAAASLTPEQRARIEEKAKARGKTLDEDRLALGLAMRLAGPRVEAVLRARLGP